MPIRTPYDMENKDKIKDYAQSTEALNFRGIINQVRDKWYWFVLYGILGVWGAYVFNKYAQPKYQIRSTILIQDEAKGMQVQDLFEWTEGGANPSIQNQIGILKSYTVHRKALEKLNWHYSWYLKGLLHNEDLYENEPFKLDIPTGAYNSTSYSLTITPLSEETYQVYCDQPIFEQNSDGKGHEKKGQFGRLFTTDYFYFTLSPRLANRVKVGEEYILSFNDLDKMALSYQGRLDIQLMEEKANLIQLTISGSQAKREVDFLETLVNVYIDYDTRQKNIASENTVNFIDNQIAGVVDSLQLAGRSFTDFRSKNQIVDLGQEASLVVTRLESLQSERSMAQMRMDYYKNLNSYLGDANRIGEVVAPSVVGITDPSLNGMVLKLTDLYSKRALLSNSGKNPLYLAIEQDITYTRQTLEENLRNLVSNAQIEINSLNQRLGQIRSQLSTLPETEQDLVNFKRQFDLNNDLYNFLLKRRAEAAISKASTVSNIQVLDKARLETVRKLSPRPSVNLLIGLALGLGLPFLLIVGTDYFNETISDKDEIERGTSIPIVASITHNNHRSYLPVEEHPHSAIAESFRLLRTNLKFLLHDQNQKVIGVHSAITNEGKTFTSMNLASIIAMNNHKVLLVGVDLRSPSLQQLFGAGNDKGLTTYLTQQQSFDEVIEWTTNNLSFIAAGPVPPNPAELLSNGKFEVFMQEARKRYDYIVLDNAPASIVTDGIIAGSHADINLFVLRERHSRKDQIKFVDDLAAQGILKRVFIVLNDVKVHSTQYGGGYGHYAEASKKKFWTRTAKAK